MTLLIRAKPTQQCNSVACRYQQHLYVIIAIKLMSARVASLGQLQRPRIIPQRHLETRSSATAEKARI